jgi:hypothetical protein
MNAEDAATAGHEQPIHFTVDGEPFVTDDRAQLASAILANYAKLDPANYQLGELHGHDPKPQLLASDEVVHIHPGARYVAVRTGPGPVE